MNIVKVKEWITWQEALNKKESIGGMGGWVVGQKWDEYLKDLIDPAKPYAEGIREAVLKDRIRWGGDWHQSDQYEGVPLFEDDTIGSFTYRAWGDILAAIWNTEKNWRRFSYNSFYMNRPDCMSNQKREEKEYVLYWNDDTLMWEAYKGEVLVKSYEFVDELIKEFYPKDFKEYPEGADIHTEIANFYASILASIPEESEKLKEERGDK